MHPLDAVDPTRSSLDIETLRPVMHNVARLTGWIEKAGMALRVGSSLQETAPIFRRSVEPLAVLADPDIQSPGETITVILTMNGRPVGCTAQRRIWVDNLAADMRSLKYWYGDPSRAPAGTTCHVPESWLDLIGSCFTVYSCSFFVAPEAQFEGVTESLIRVGHALALVSWRWDWLLGRGKNAIAARYPLNVYGVSDYAAGVFLLGPGVEPHVAHQHYLMGASRAAFLAQASHALYGNPQQSLAIPPALRGPAATEVSPQP